MRPLTEPHPRPGGWIARRRGRPRGLNPRAVTGAVAAVAATLAVGLGGCGQQVRAPRGDRLRIVLTEDRLRPDRVTAPAGRLRLLVRNLGRLSHNLSVLRAARVVAGTAPIPPGGSAQLVVTLTPGSYTLASTVQDDEALGIRGSLTVVRR